MEGEPVPLPMQLTLRWTLFPPPPTVSLAGAGSESVLSEGELVFLHSDHPEDENSFEEPSKVRL